MTPEEFYSHIIEKVRDTRARIVFDELDDNRVMAAVKRLSEERLCIPVLVGENVSGLCEQWGLNEDRVICYDVKENSELTEQLAQQLYEIRKDKLTREQAELLIRDPIYFGTMLVKTGYADGLVSGAAHPTSRTLRPAFQIIGTREPFTIASGSFIMFAGVGPFVNKPFLFADCAALPSPTSQQLAEIAVESALTYHNLGLGVPRVALLSFSTKGSADTPEVKKIRDAVQLANHLLDHVGVKGYIDGELQVDAALIPDVARRKIRGESEVGGKANVLIFPDLNSGNIGYKLVQRFTDGVAIGPIMQGLAAPVNDLSRGCTEEEVFYTAIITALQTRWVVV